MPISSFSGATPCITCCSKWQILWFHVTAGLNFGTFCTSCSCCLNFCPSACLGSCHLSLMNVLMQHLLWSCIWPHIPFISVFCTFILFILLHCNSLFTDLSLPTELSAVAKLGPCDIYSCLYPQSLELKNVFSKYLLSSTKILSQTFLWGYL